MTATDIQWPTTVQRRLRSLRVNFINAKSREAELCNERNSLKDEVRRVGREPNKRRLELDHSLVECLLGIEYQRKRKAWLADELAKTIDQADQGKLFEDEMPTDVDEQTLFDGDGDDEEIEQPVQPAPRSRPVGIPTPASDAPSGDSHWLRMPGRFLIEAGAGRNRKAKEVVCYTIASLHQACSGSIDEGRFDSFVNHGDHARVHVGSKVALKVSRLESAAPIPPESPRPDEDLDPRTGELTKQRIRKSKS